MFIIDTNVIISGALNSISEEVYTVDEVVLESKDFVSKAIVDNENVLPCAV